MDVFDNWRPTSADMIKLALFERTSSQLAVETGLGEFASVEIRYRFLRTFLQALPVIYL